MAGRIEKTACPITSNKVYRRLLQLLTLEERHSNGLLARGLHEVEIKAGMYATMPLDREVVLMQLCNEFPEGDLLSVAGFYMNNSKVALNSAAGLIVPVRDIAERIVGLKVRTDNPAAVRKYSYVSSAPSTKETGKYKFPHGTAAKAAIHFPMKLADRSFVKDVIRITEGELKAESATALSDIYTISIPGVTLWSLLAEHMELLKRCRVLVSFDSDKADEFQTSTGDNEAGDVGVQCARLYQWLKQNGVDAHIEHWDGEAGKGIDDVLINGTLDTIPLMSETEAEQFCVSMGSDAPEAGWVFVVDSNEFFHTATKRRLTKEGFDSMFAPSYKVSASKTVLKDANFPRYDQFIYAPNGGLIIPQGHLRCVNTWQGNKGLQPEAASVEMFLQHMEYLLPDERERAAMMDFIAWNVQHPGKKLQYAMVLQGVEGTGKSYVAWCIAAILGNWNVSFPSNEALLDRYTDYLMDCSLIVIEEIMTQGRRQVMNRLKTGITQPQVQIRQMYKSEYSIPNVANYLMLTNYADALLLDRNDRRYCILNSPAAPKEITYYNRLWKWSESNLPAIAHYLLNYDLRHFNQHSRAPMTEGKRAMVDSSMGDMDAWFAEHIIDMAWPFAGDLINLRLLQKHLPKNLYGNSNLIRIAQTMQRLGCVKLRQIDLNNGTHGVVWSVRDHEKYTNMSGADLSKIHAAGWDAGIEVRETEADPLHATKPM